MQKIKLNRVILLVGGIGVVAAFFAISLDDDGVHNEAIIASRCLGSVVGGGGSAGNFVKMDYLGDKGESFYRYKYGDDCFVDVVVNKGGLCDVLGVSKACDSLKEK